MKIAITQNERGLWERFIDFYRFLLKNGHEVIFYDNFSEPPDADVWFFDYYIHNTCWGMSERINEYESVLTKYSGKLIFYSLDDGGNTWINGVFSSIMNKVDAWASFVRRTDDNCFYDHNTMNNKILLLPRYYVDYRPLPTYKKINRSVFIGRTTGAVAFGGKNWRVEGLKKIKKNSFLNDRFVGGVVDDVIIDIGIEQRKHYDHTFNEVVVPRISHAEWIKWLDTSQIAINFPGHTRWSYRQPESLRSKCTVLSFKLNNVPDPGKWMFDDIFKDEFYWIEDDMSNFESLLEYALIHENESKEKAELGYKLYQKYFELTPDGDYNKETKEELRKQFELLNIKL